MGGCRIWYPRGIVSSSLGALFGEVHLGHRQHRSVSLYMLHGNHAAWSAALLAPYSAYTQPGGSTLSSAVTTASPRRTLAPRPYPGHSSSRPSLCPDILSNTPEHAGHLRVRPRCGRSRRRRPSAGALVPILHRRALGEDGGCIGYHRPVGRIDPRVGLVVYIVGVVGDLIPIFGLVYSTASRACSLCVPSFSAGLDECGALCRDIRPKIHSYSTGAPFLPRPPPLPRSPTTPGP